MIKKEADKFSSSNILEGMTSISALLNSQVQNNRKIETIWIDQAKKKAKAREIGFLNAKAQEHRFEIKFVSSQQIEEITVGSSHGGIIAFCTERTLPPLSAADILPNGFYVYLEGIEDPYNFGYTLRSLYAAGVNGVILPPRNWMNAAGVVARASAGASELLSIYTGAAEDVIKLFKQSRYQVLCAGIRNSVSIFESDFHYPLLLVIGGEKRGISGKLLEQADQIVRIDYGTAFRGSLSSASAATVIAFEIFRQNKKAADK